MGKLDHAPLRALLTRSRVAPDYTMGALAERAGIPPDTLRSWERRYGFPRPQRTPTNRRLYSDQDIAAIRWILEERERGQGVHEAIALVKATLDGGPEKGPRPIGEPSALDAFIERLTTGDLAGAQDTWDGIATAISPAALAEQVILAALGDVSPDDVAALAWLRRKATVLLDAAGPDRGEPAIALALDGGARAEVAAMVLATALARAGCQVLTPFADARDVVSLTRLRRLAPARLALVSEREPDAELAATVRAVASVEAVLPWSPLAPACPQGSVANMVEAIRRA